MSVSRRLPSQQERRTAKEARIGFTSSSSPPPRCFQTPRSKKGGHSTNTHSHDLFTLHLQYTPRERGTPGMLVRLSLAPPHVVFPREGEKRVLTKELISACRDVAQTRPPTRDVICRILFLFLPLSLKLFGVAVFRVAQKKQEVHRFART